MRKPYQMMNQRSTSHPDRLVSTFSSILLSKLNIVLQAFNTVGLSAGAYVANAGHDINNITYTGINDNALASIASINEPLKFVHNKEFGISLYTRSYTLSSMVFSRSRDTAGYRHLTFPSISMQHVASINPTPDPGSLMAPNFHSGRINLISFSACMAPVSAFPLDFCILTLTN